MRNTNLLALAAALILACVWAWASSTGTKAAAPTGYPDRPVPSHRESSSADWSPTISIAPAIPPSILRDRHEPRRSSGAGAR